MQSLLFLGHIVTYIEIAPDPQKIEAVQKIQPPKPVTQLRSFLGLVGYYQQFIRDFSKIAQLLNQLLCKDISYMWDKPQREAFEELKQRLVTAPILKYPNFDKFFILATNASYHGFETTLSQLDKDRKEHSVVYTSKSLTKGEVNYEATELEYAAIVWTIKHFHKYLE